MKKFILLLGLGLLINIGFTQNFISGVVTDTLSGQPIIGANIVLDNERGTVTQLNGSYKLSVEPGKYLLTCSFVGFEKQQKPIEVLPNQPIEVNFSLSLNPTGLKTLVITASKTQQEIEKVPVSMEVLKPGLIETKNTYNLETAIEQVPSVSVIDGQANIRGGGGYSYGAGSRVMVLLDDMPLISGDANDVKWNYLPVENIAQVEVLKGASSALFGSSALNGVINLQTQKPAAQPQTSLNIFQGIYHDPVRPDTLGNRRDSAGNLYKPLKWNNGANPTFTGFNFNHLQRVNKFDFGIQLSGLSDNGYKQGETEQRLRAAFQLGYNLNNQWRFELNGAAMRVSGGIFFIWESDSTALIPNGGLDTATTTISFYTNTRFHIDPKATFYARNGDVHQFKSRIFYTDNQNITQPSATAISYYSEYQYQHSFSERLDFTSGLANTYVEVKSALYGNHTSQNVAPYAQLNFSQKKLNLSFGARAEYFRIDNIETNTDWLLPRGLVITPNNTVWRDTLVLAKNMNVKPVMRLAANYSATKSTFLRASFGQGYRFPSIAEKFVATSISLLRVFPNPDLQAETGWNAEIGAKQIFRIGEFKGFADVAYFWTEYQNMMEFTFGLYLPDSIAQPTFNDVLNNIGFKSINIGKARINGLDFSIGGEGKIGQVKTSVMAGYTYMNPINLGFDSAYQAGFSDTGASPILKYRYRHLAKADVMFEYKKWLLGASGRYNSFMENIDKSFEEPLIGTLEFTKILPGLKEYRQRFNQGDYVLDVRLGYTINQNSKVTLVVNNVLNREIMGRPGDILPPRTTAIQYALKF